MRVEGSSGLESYWKCFRLLGFVYSIIIVDDDVVIFCGLQLSYEIVSYITPSLYNNSIILTAVNFDTPQCTNNSYGCMALLSYD